MYDKLLTYSLYLGDADEDNVYSWLCGNIAPVIRTTQAEHDYFKMYHGDQDLWSMHSTDVSDVSGSYDTVTLIGFKHKEDAVMARLQFGGSMS
jgi:hypothetical protein